MAGTPKAACFALAVLLSAGTVAFAADLPIKQGLPLGAMDALLLRAGWQPAKASVQLGGGVGTIYQAGYHAVQMCAGTGSNPCVFNYAKQGKCLRIVTRGEYNPPEYEPVVESWTYACPDK
jgi:hypothetical protein